jgi:hypothetical protein
MRSMEEEKERERFEIVRNLVHTKLQETGDLDRLRCYVRRRLVAAGWKCDMMKELRVAVNENGVCNVNVQHLHDKIAISGRKFDDRVKEEALKKIEHCYKNAISKEADDTIVNRRYINELRDEYL